MNKNVALNRGNVEIGDTVKYIDSDNNLIIGEVVNIFENIYTIETNGFGRQRINSLNTVIQLLQPNGNFLDTYETIRRRYHRVQVNRDMVWEYIVKILVALFILSVARAVYVGFFQ